MVVHNDVCVHSKRISQSVEQNISMSEEVKAIQNRGRKEKKRKTLREREREMKTY
jgi:hypothetical protein